MKIITYAQLRKAGACNEQLSVFKAIFGRQVGVSPELAEQYAAKFDFNWAAANLLSDLAGAEYERVCAPAWAEYERVCDLAGAEYERVCDLVWAEYEQRVCDPAWAKFDFNWAAANLLSAPAWAEYERVCAPAWAEYERVSATAFARAYLSMEE